ncbi:MAG: aminotransferase class III-fold pyridoxal phosphate-dependent enzyme [Armatimonadota bacterium]
MTSIGRDESIVNWTFTEVDEEIAREVQARLPARIIDAHAHLYRSVELNLPERHVFMQGPATVTTAEWLAHQGRQLGAERMQGALFLATPLMKAENLPAHNDFMLAQAAALPESRVLLGLAPEMTKEQFLPYLDNPQFAGFKPYHVFSPQKPTFQAPIASFLPEWAWEFADAHGMIITLHMVKDAALADPENQREIREHCLRYPNARLILAHAARGFHAPNTVRHIASLRGLQNVYFDMAAVCESAPMKAIIEEFGPRKLLWGSDYPVSEIRGRCVTLGDSFLWLDRDSIRLENSNVACRPALIGLESARAMLEAADDLRLNADDLQDIFADNARRLFGQLDESGTTQERYRYAKTRIPGGVQLLSKRPEQYAPDQWPGYYREARGCEVWDLDGRHYYDMVNNAVGSCLLGYADPDVNAAVHRRVTLGSMCTLNAPDEVELSDLLCEIHPWAEQVRFGRPGGEACGIAVRIARATTDRSIVAICGYHGWQDWYLAANLGAEDALRGHLLPGLNPLGVPRELRGSALTFTYGNREEFQAVLDAAGDRLAAVIMEPCRYHDPEPGWLEHVRDSVHQAGGLLIFDEITIGWRLHHGGAHLRFGVEPDIAVFAKAMGNGYPMAAIIGTQAAMEGAHSSFISSTYWTEGIGPAAALATIRKLKAVNATAHVAQIGNQVKDLWATLGAKHGLPVHTDDGYPCLAHFAFQHEQADALRTLYTQLMLQRGFLAGTAIYPTMGHTPEIVAKYGEAIDEVFGEIAEALATDSVMERLNGPIAHSGFRRLL